MIIINGFKNPLISSTGLGVGSKIFEYLNGLDAAIGFENHELMSLCFI